MLAISHTYGASRSLARGIAARCARSIEFENAWIAPREKSRFKASQLPPGCLRCRRHRSAFDATLFRIRERSRTACALPLLTVFKFVAIMRQSAGNGKWNTAMRRGAPALRTIDDAARCAERGVEMCRRASRTTVRSALRRSNHSTLR
jgi:hypothetical protein